MYVYSVLVMIDYNLKDLLCSLFSLYLLLNVKQLDSRCMDALSSSHKTYIRPPFVNSTLLR